MWVPFPCLPLQHVTQLKDASYLTSTIVDMQPKVGVIAPTVSSSRSGTPMSPLSPGKAATATAVPLSSDDRVVAVAAEVSAVLPPRLKREEAGALAFTVVKATGLPDCLSTVLQHEMERYNRLLTVIDDTVQQLQRAIKGLVVMSDHLEAVYTSLLSNKVSGERDGSRVEG